jgi:hypothetical protein
MTTKQASTHPQNTLKNVAKKSERAGAQKKSCGDLEKPLMGQSTLFLNT